jgi:hypothetical protein
MNKVVRKNNYYTSYPSGIAESMVHGKFLEQNTGEYFFLLLWANLCIIWA